MQNLIQSEDPSTIRRYLKENNFRRIFLVTGKGSFKASGSQKFIMDAIDGLDYFIYNDFSVNPKFEEILFGVTQFNTFKPDIIIAIGGGSVIDMAKSINIISSNIKIVDPLDILTKNKIEKCGVTLIAIPTTAGSGSEATHFAVVYYENIKYSIANKYLLPTVVVLNSQLIRSNPKNVSISSGLDSIAQAIESIWSINSTEESLYYGQKALDLLIHSISNYISNPTLENSQNMLLGAYYAGKAINISKTTAPHALSYAFSTFYGVPHGDAVFFTLPLFLKYNDNINISDCVDARGPDFVRSKIQIIQSILNVNSIDEAFLYLKTLPNKLGSEFLFDSIKSQIDLKKVKSSVNIERLKNNPRLVTRENLDEILD